MKVLFVASEFPPGPGGIGTHAFELARHLQAFGHDVVTLANQDYASDGDIAAFNDQIPFRVDQFARHPIPLVTGGQRLYQLWKAYRKVKPDVIVASGKQSVWLTALLGLRRSTPWIAVGHGTEFGASQGWQRLLTRIAFEQADALVSVSAFTQSTALKMGIRPHQSYVIHNGANPERFRMLPHEDVVRYRRERLGLEEGHIVCTVGRVAERKGQHVVIQALPEVLDEVPDVHYVMAGLPEEQSRCARMAARLGVQDHVHFLGRVDDEEVVHLLNASDVFAMTSVTTDSGDMEGYGIAVIEAALCGTPAVVSEGSGLVEAIVPGETGIAVPEDDPSSTADALVRLFRNTELRAALGQAARRRARTEQTWEQRVRQYEALLFDVVRDSI